MANTKKHPSMRKKTACYSVQLKVLRDFNDKCELNDLVPSNVIQELIEKYVYEENMFVSKKEAKIIQKKPTTKTDIQKNLFD